ncbi:homogentisate 1,2-dioxygenase [Alteribacillus sp. YIM 98480]|uniref:homogentisate 1,2-dioxygenase n=1 Tax=Alteribacillus sp. YIM 98480 TaxID=2606599 RepID=UPI00131BA64B|nr:homogentisate 1,2-dioxygenase [Alteribacillus sp. YIM 98480]
MAFKEKVTASGRTYSIQRENQPTVVNSFDGPELTKINLKDPALKPTNMSDSDGTPMPILEADGLRFDLSKRTQKAMDFWHRSGDNDEVILCVEGQIKWETELGNVTLNAGEVLVIPRGIAHRSLPGTPPEGGNNLIVELKVKNPLKNVSEENK